MNAEKVKEGFRKRGETIKSWCDERGYDPTYESRILNGTIKANRGKAHEAVWFQESGNPGQGGYFDFAGESLRRAYLAAPLPVLRVTSQFGERHHPILG